MTKNDKKKFGVKNEQRTPPFLEMSKETKNR